MSSTQYLDFNICNFSKYNIFKNIERIDESEKVTEILRKFNKAIIENLKEMNVFERLPCRMSVTHIKNVVHQIFPRKIFGSRHNFVKFFGVIKKFCTATFFENISYYSLLKGWRLADVTWLKNLKEENQRAIIIRVIIWLIHIFKRRILKKYFFVQAAKKSYKVNYYPINAYKSLYSRSINEMIKKQQLIPIEDISNKKVICKTKLSILPRSQMSTYRPIVRTRLLRDINKKIVMPLLKNKGAVFDRNMYTAWSDFVKVSGDKPIYGFKIDLKDAFSNVNIDQLKPLIKKFLNKKPVYRDAILNALENQVVRVYKNKYYTWNRGLMQGMRLSAQLCDLSRVKELLEQSCQISQEKTQDNLKDNYRILFNGRVFNLKTKEVEIYIDSDLDTFRYKSKLFYSKRVNQANPLSFLKEVGSVKINTYNFNKILLNVNFNTKDTVYQNYFKAIITVAFKIDCAIKERLKKTPQDLTKFILDLIKFYVRYTRKMLIKTKTDPEERMNIRRKVLKFVGIKAFILVLQKRYLSYKDTIISLKEEIKNVKDSDIGTKFNKLPSEFAGIRMKRILPQYK